MTIKEMQESVVTKILQYNDEKAKDDKDQALCDRLRKELDKEVEDIAKAQTDEVYAKLMGASNPMYEAAKTFEFEVDILKDKVDKATHEVTGVETGSKMVKIDPAKVTDGIIQLAVKKDNTLPKNGVVANGKAWIYALERLCNMIAYRNAKALNMSEADLRTIVESSYLSEAAEKVKNGETPTSNTKMIDAIQAVIDMMLFIPGPDGKNAVRIESRDVKFICDNCVSHGKGAGVMKQARTRAVQNLIFEVCHLIIVDKSYTYMNALKKGVVLAGQPSRNQKAKESHPLLINEDGSLIVEVKPEPAAKSKKVSAPTPVEQTAEVEKIA